MSSSKARAEKEREKQVQEKVQSILGAMLKDEDNKYCVDCDSKGPRWASWNLGIFLCIRCAGIHRNLGVHISRVKSVNLDSWTPQQVASMQMMGNSRARAVYEANLPDDYKRPQNDQAVEAFIRAKYEKKKWIASEWRPGTPPQFPSGWDEAGNTSLDKKPEFKKLTVPSSTGAQRQSSSSPAAPAKTVQNKPAPAVVTKPSTAAPASIVKSASTLESDLLGLSLSSSTSSATPSSSTASSVPSSASAQDLLGLNSEFSGFVSAPAVSSSSIASSVSPANTASESVSSDATATNNSVTDGKMSKDSIMALFGPKSSPTPASVPMQNFSSPNQFANLQQQQFGGIPSQQFGGQQQQQFGGLNIQQQQPQQQFGGLNLQPQQQQQQQPSMFGQFQQPQQQQQHNDLFGAFAGLGQLGPQQQQQQQPVFNQAVAPNQANNILDMFGSKPAQINNNQSAPANNPFLDTNQFNGLNSSNSTSLWQ